jgi:hypothetical protein
VHGRVIASVLHLHRVDIVGQAEEHDSFVTQGYEVFRADLSAVFVFQQQAIEAATGNGPIERDDWEAIEFARQKKGRFSTQVSWNYDESFDIAPQHSVGLFVLGLGVFV